MRLLAVIAVFGSAILLPALAVGDPQGFATASGQPGSAATAPPATSPQPAAAQMSRAPSQQSTATSASSNTGPESVVVRADAVDLDQIVCKEVPPKIGSRIGGGRECHSQREWNRVQRESQDITRHYQRIMTGR